MSLHDPFHRRPADIPGGSPPRGPRQLFNCQILILTHFTPCVNHPSLPTGQANMPPVFFEPIYRPRAIIKDKSPGWRCRGIGPDPIFFSRFFCGTSPKNLNLISLLIRIFHKRQTTKPIDTGAQLLPCPLHCIVDIGLIDHSCLPIHKLTEILDSNAQPLPRTGYRLQTAAASTHYCATCSICATSASISCNPSCQNAGSVRSTPSGARMASGQSDPPARSTSR
jgi:hypothetical protein